VTHATGLTAMPFHDAGNDLAYSLPNDTPGAATNRPFADFLGADPDYFQTLGIAVRKGRVFTDDDRRGTARVAVVDELLARQAWPNRDPIGQQIGVGLVYYTVVGVVAPTRYRNLLAPRATLYTAYAQSMFAMGYIGAPVYIAVRTSADPARSLAALHTAVRETDSRLFLADVATLGDRIDDSLAPQRLTAFLLAAFGLAVLLLTGVGVYSVAATFVRYREFEIGVRSALGATPGDVAQLVIRQGSVIIAAGTAIGVLAALLAGTVLASLAYGATTRDPIALSTAVGAVGVVAAIALVLPARRASRLNPADVLRRG
jgi:ABC-type antimicrobial peptide transport system permease subunit